MLCVYVKTPTWFAQQRLGLQKRARELKLSDADGVGRGWLGVRDGDVCFDDEPSLVQHFLLRPRSDEQTPFHR